MSQHLTQVGLAQDQPNLRIPAAEVERVVSEQLQQALGDEALMLQWLDLGGASLEQARAALKQATRTATQMQTGTDQQRIAVLQAMLERVSVSPTSIELCIASSGLRALLGMPPAAQPSQASHTINVSVRLKRRGGASRLVIGDDRVPSPTSAPDPVLLNAVAKAFAWQQQLLTDPDATPASIADTEGVTMSYVARVLHLAALAPDMVEAIMKGRQPVELTLDGLMSRLPLPLGWAGQRLALGSA